MTKKLLYRHYLLFLMVFRVCFFQGNEESLCTWGVLQNFHPMKRCLAYDTTGAKENTFTLQSGLFGNFIISLTDLGETGSFYGENISRFPFCQLSVI